MILLCTNSWQNMEASCPSLQGVYLPPHPQPLLALATHNSPLLCLIPAGSSTFCDFIFFLVWSLIRCVLGIIMNQIFIIPCIKEFVCRAIFHCLLWSRQELPFVMFGWVIVILNVSCDQTSLRVTEPGEELGLSLFSGPRRVKAMLRSGEN